MAGMKSPIILGNSLVLLGCLILNAALQGSDGLSSPYRRLANSVDMPLDSDVFAVPPGNNAPQQVHITQGNVEGNAIIVSWTTPDHPGPCKVKYWKENTTEKHEAESSLTRYNYFNYTSGFIYKSNLSCLDFDTKYFYQVGQGNSSRTFWFRTPPQVGPDVPYTFGIIGDLGQTFDSNSTLTHYENGPVPGKAMLYLGDFSYADQYPNHDNVRWDTWSRFVERSAAYQPWIWTVGNHEIDYAPEIGETEPFKPFKNRFPTPFQASGSSAPYWYSIKRGPAYIIVMASYSGYNKYTPQYVWLQTELAKVNRSETPWLIVLVHSPIYNSYVSHYMEGETMRAIYEPFFVKAKVDIVLAGHVHAYERSGRFSNIAYNVVNGLCTPVKDLNAPVYLTVGDGGNLEGLSTVMTEPQPNYSVFREPSFGHGVLDIENRTHARFSWHRNQDGFAVEADSVLLTNRVWLPTDDSV